MTALGILIVTVDPLRRLVLASQVAALGHRPVEPAEGHDARAVLTRRDSVDLAVVDEDAWSEAEPGVGREVSRSTRVPLVLLVDYGDAETRPAHPAAAHMLTKPVSVEDLAVAIPAARRRFDRWRALEDAIAMLGGATVVDMAVRLVARDRDFTRDRAERWLEQRSASSGRTTVELARTMVAADALHRSVARR